MTKDSELAAFQLEADGSVTMICDEGARFVVPVAGAADDDLTAAKFLEAIGPCAIGGVSPLVTYHRERVTVRGRQIVIFKPIPNEARQ